jgi:hypothetical protein
MFIYLLRNLLNVLIFCQQKSWIVFSIVSSIAFSYVNFSQGVTIEM